MNDGAIALTDLWHLAAGLLGAFGNQVLYWQRQLRARSQPVNRRMIPVSAAYVVTGGGIGFFVGVEGGILLLSLGSGAFWPETLKALDAARKVAVIVKRRLGGGDGPFDPSLAEPGG